MKYSEAEKLQLLMLCDIYEKSKIQDGIKTNIIREAIDTGNTWAISWLYPSIDEKEKSPNDVNFVCKVLDMYIVLESTYNQLDSEKQSLLTTEASPFGGRSSVIFPGFDGNNEADLMSIGEMLHRLGRYKNIDTSKNTHIPTRETYSRMLSVYEEHMLAIGFTGIEFTYEALRDTLLARIHPSQRY
ncbi:YfbU family protein [Xenorhabdus bovienii]|uniref:YfbU family protein n=1 Tax=Xenorhabdus bovienii TaxID=40576 RepID=UPI0023B24C90|nr:YfbU family protein [Xenorhabdus bovienii]MDE9565458.1 YfbU family protein [Xenorhabdus bovienii]